MKRISDNVVHKYRNIGFLLTICLIIFFTVGYAALSTDFDISNLSAIVRVSKDIRINAVTLDNVTSSASTNWEEYNVNSILAGINLPNSDSTVTYNVRITNIGNVEATISDITGLPSNLEYTLNNYTLKDMLCDDIDNTKCTLGSNSTISITIGYKENGYDSTNTTYSLKVDFAFNYMTDAIAKIGNKYYDSLVSAVAAVPTNTETTILLLNNTNENVIIPNNKNIILNLNGKTLGNDGNTNIIANSGTLVISGGVIRTTAPDKGAVDNNGSAAHLTIDNVRISATGRQALYNDGGTVTIRGNSNLNSSSTIRAALQNKGNSSTMYLESGTVVSSGFSAIVNSGVLSVGVSDGNVSTTSPMIKGLTYGIENDASFNFYDGIAKGITAGIKVNNRVVPETGYSVATSTETIDGQVYHTAFIAVVNTVTFNAQGGSLSERTRKVADGFMIGELPTVTRNGYEFLGWFTSDNVLVDDTLVITEDITLYAHWEKLKNGVIVGTTRYDSLQEGINAAPNGVQTTVTLLKDLQENINVATSKNIIIDLGGFTLRNNSIAAVIENDGTLAITNGTLTSNSTNNSVINMNMGNLTITDTNVIATGARQALYINGGTATISGNSYLTSKASGAYQNIDRATVQNNAGTLIITGGTIESTAQHAVNSASALTIGVQDGSINTTSPVMIGTVDGVKITGSGTLNFYDGIAKGKVHGINGTITLQEANSTLASGTETINGATYQTNYLESN